MNPGLNPIVSDNVSYSLESNPSSKRHKYSAYISRKHSSEESSHELNMAVGPQGSIRYSLRVTNLKAQSLKNDIRTSKNESGSIKKSERKLNELTPHFLRNSEFSVTPKVSSSSSVVPFSEVERSIYLTQIILNDDPYSQVPEDLLQSVSSHHEVRDVLSKWDYFDIIRLSLIYRKIKKTASNHELFILIFLNEMARFRRNLLAPLPLKHITQVEQQYKDRLADIKHGSEHH
jgi:hypothetical protein